jgi:glucan phosphorylase
MNNLFFRICQHLDCVGILFELSMIVAIASHKITTINHTPIEAAIKSFPIGYFYQVLLLKRKSSATILFREV